MCLLLLLALWDKLVRLPGDDEVVAVEAFDQALVVGNKNVEAVRDLWFELLD